MRAASVEMEEVTAADDVADRQPAQAKRLVVDAEREDRHRTCAEDLAARIGARKREARIVQVERPDGAAEIIDRGLAIARLVRREHAAADLGEPQLLADIGNAWRAAALLGHLLPPVQREFHGGSEI